MAMQQVLSVELDDGASLVGATAGEFDRKLQVYDDMFGPLWVYGEVYGPIAVVRAQTFQDAYEIVVDDILKPIDRADVPEAYGFDTQDDLDRAVARARENGEELPHLIEGYQYQPNCTDTGIVSISDYEWMEELTEALRARHKIKIEVEIKD